MKQTHSRNRTTTTTRHTTQPATTTIYRVDCWRGDVRDCRVWCRTRSQARQLQREWEATSDTAHPHDHEERDATISEHLVELTPHGLIDLLSVYAK